ncbi:PREDICTED: regulator of G-protein signaling 20 isoform X2 [Nicrophorus vespilloides]|uniref:Regulator of G-protein signaling 20 isoform X2 n=1 Tax=Nicrophorus vespilloides TaxID=110193 RepID=A0ABM1NAI9_NICVS|nr:PREDICTED: regulator of G-protein signaling 20 isoform X2 [Nicrophorus vespilloides]
MACLKDMAWCNFIKKMPCGVSKRVPENRARKGSRNSDDKGGEGPSNAGADNGNDNGNGGGGSGLAGLCRRKDSNSSTASPPTSKSGHSIGSGQSKKPCCLCWCCCCSCSWVANKTGAALQNCCCCWCCSKWKQITMMNGGEVKQNSFCCSTTPSNGNIENGPSKTPNNSDVTSYDSEPQAPIEEIRTWGKSFDKLMRSPAGRRLFREFLKCEYSEENILFWLACEDLKIETSTESVEEKARIIYEDYISILSPKEVSLDSRVREIVNRNMVNPTPDTFEEAQVQIYTLMHRDSYPRFVNSALYKNLAQHGNIEPDLESIHDSDSQNG